MSVLPLEANMPLVLWCVFDNRTGEQALITSDPNLISHVRAAHATTHTIRAYGLLQQTVKEPENAK